jgi:hypothetical protein
MDRNSIALANQKDTTNNDNYVRELLNLENCALLIIHLNQIEIYSVYNLGNNYELRLLY